ncbi:MAG TPA: ADOP family duplicated permease, partial [Thermoanaerobaculia bacterium]|nr:ADOP family duplicated permease [Thermoanaerobaculia bacterium]
SYTIVGILPEEARFPEPDVQVWLPLSVADPVAAPVRGVHFLHAALRLRRRSTIAAGRAEIAAADRWLERNYPEENRARRRSLEPLRERLAAGPRRTLLILFGAVGLVLLIACANFAGLLLARASARRREMAIRGSLGAGAGRLVRQLLTESVVLALLGGIAGLAAAKFGVRALAALPTGAGNGIVPVRIDGGVFAFATGVAAATGLIFGLVPALSASRYDFASALRDSARGSATRHELRLRRVLVVAEVALALVLLAGAGLLIRTLRNLRSVPPGFRAEHLLTFRLELPAARYESLDLQRMFRDRVTAALDALPGTSAALVSELPMSGEALPHNLTIAGRPPVTPGDEPEVLTRTVSDGYFRVLGIPIRRGRALQPADRETAPQVVVVNESFVRAYFPSGDPVGARIRWSREAPPRWMTIVGVVGDVNHFGPARGDQPAVYGTWAQATEPWKRWMYVVVRSTGDEASLLREATNRIGALDPQLPLTKVRSMEEVIDSSVSTRRFDALLLSVFALLALALASVGIYGLISYSVAQRRHDIGVRMALGADAGAIVRLIVGDGVRLAAAGAAIGLAGALLATRLMESLLFGVGARDPATLGAVIAVLTAVAAVASWIPARSATKVDPAVALRVE